MSENAVDGPFIHPNDRWAVELESAGWRQQSARLSFGDSSNIFGSGIQYL